MEELIREMARKELSKVFEMGLRQSPTDAENSEFYRPMIDLNIAPKLAKEIAAHVKANYYEKEFVEWKDDNTCYDDFYTVYSLNTAGGTYCIKTLYQYWLTNIKKL